MSRELQEEFDANFLPLVEKAEEIRTKNKVFISKEFVKEHINSVEELRSGLIQTDDKRIFYTCRPLTHLDKNNSVTIDFMFDFKSKRLFANYVDGQKDEEHTCLVVGSGQKAILKLMADALDRDLDEHSLVRSSDFEVYGEASSIGLVNRFSQFAKTMNTKKEKSYER